MATIIIGGDLCPIERNRACFESGDAQSLFHDLLPEFESADLCIANLECPLIEAPTPISKTGPTFGESGACIRGIKNSGINLLCLANNHILDHGQSGLQNTLRICAQEGIATVGAGNNLEAARRIMVKEVSGLRIGILAMAEQEFSLASKNSGGANPLDLIDCVRNIRAHRESFDYFIVLLHASLEFHVPTPRIQDTCRFLAEMGADLVVVQHPHVLGGYETYEGSHIIYGQGALVMDEFIYRELKSFHEGFLVKVKVAKDTKASLEIVPFIQSDPVPGARKLCGELEKQFRDALAGKSKRLSDAAFVEAEWVKFCRSERHDYLSSLLGHNRLLARLNWHGLIEKTLHGKSALLRAKNIVCCETHREAIQTIFDDLRKNGAESRS